MARYLLDSSTLIRFHRGDEPLSSRLMALASSSHEVGVCPVVVAEVFSGVRPDDREQWRRVFQQFIVWSEDIETGVRAGELRHDAARRGRQASLPDAMIAAVALRNRATLVTENLRDFQFENLTAIALSQQPYEG